MINPSPCFDPIGPGTAQPNPEAQRAAVFYGDVPSDGAPNRRAVYVAMLAAVASPQAKIPRRTPRPGQASMLPHAQVACIDY